MFTMGGGVNLYSIQTRKYFIKFLFNHVCFRAGVCTIDCKDIFDLLLYDFQSHLNPIGAGHGVDLIGVKLVDVQDLEKQDLVVVSLSRHRVRPLVSMMTAFWARVDRTEVRSKCTLLTALLPRCLDALSLAGWSCGFFALLGLQRVDLRGGFLQVSLLFVGEGSVRAPSPSFLLLCLWCYCSLAAVNLALYLVTAVVFAPYPSVFDCVVCFGSRR
ncbi:hypothetical protein XENOCAPTIV_013013 [Xenoophorus captivus]|uniref:Uncharacterized protein n=1 Tax=Xenoophorus captivus TaxID=1517983 RepID=A0ABV0R059_9TELE